MRSYTAQNIIALPTLNTAAAVALGQGLLTAVRAQPELPQLISKRASLLEKAHAALHGGQTILDQLKVAHQAYGDALGITAETQDSTTGLREPLRAFTKALRAYVLAVAAHADDDDTASIDLTDALLAPLQNWRSYISASAAQAEPIEPLIPAAPGGPIILTPGTATGMAPPAGATTPAPTNGTGESTQH